MRYLSTLVLLMSLSANTMAAQTIADADSYNAVAYFTSGLVDGKPVDRIDIAYLGQDSIVLYVDWDKLRLRAYRTEVRIIDPNGQVVGILAGGRVLAGTTLTTTTGPARWTLLATGPIRCMSMVAMRSRHVFQS